MAAILLPPPSPPPPTRTPAHTPPTPNPFHRHHATRARSSSASPVPDPTPPSSLWFVPSLPTCALPARNAECGLFANCACGPSRQTWCWRSLVAPREPCGGRAAWLTRAAARVQCHRCIDADQKQTGAQPTRSAHPANPNDMRLTSIFDENCFAATQQRPSPQQDSRHQQHAPSQHAHTPPAPKPVPQTLQARARAQPEAPNNTPNSVGGSPSSIHHTRPPNAAHRPDTHSGLAPSSSADQFGSDIMQRLSALHVASGTAPEAGASDGGAAPHQAPPGAPTPTITPTIPPTDASIKERLRGLRPQADVTEAELHARFQALTGRTPLVAISNSGGAWDGVGGKWRMRAAHTSHVPPARVPPARVPAARVPAARVPRSAMVRRARVAFEHAPTAVALALCTAKPVPGPRPCRIFGFALSGCSVPCLARVPFVPFGLRRRACRGR